MKFTVDTDLNTVTLHGSVTAEELRNTIVEWDLQEFTIVPHVEYIESGLYNPYDYNKYKVTCNDTTDVEGFINNVRAGKPISNP